MPSSTPRHVTPRSATFHDAEAKSAYTSRFRAIGIQAVAAGTRRAPSRPQNEKDIPAILRNGHDD